MPPAPARPLAYLLTWTCYGARLHGDERTTVDDRRNIPNTPPIPAAPTWQAWEAQQMTQPPFTLTDADRRVVQETIEAHCRIRGWTLLAVAVRTNHVHIVVCCGDAAPETAMNQFKAWATRRLREAGHITAWRRVRTRHGSTRYLWDRAGLEGAVRYVNETHGEL